MDYEGRNSSGEKDPDDEGEIIHLTKSAWSEQANRSYDADDSGDDDDSDSDER